MKNVNISLPVPLALIFITLKLTGVINWSWLWVLSPLWIPVTILLSVLILGTLIYFVICAYVKLKPVRNK